MPLPWQTGWPPRSGRCRPPIQRAGRSRSSSFIRDAVQRADPAGEFGTYDLYASRALDDATETVIYQSLSDALVRARLAAAKLDQQQVDAMTRVKRPTSTIVTAAGEQRSQRKLMQMLPFMVGLFIFVGVITSGQTLMTSTVEEKSSRVVEVLLAAVSPFQLMAGKLLGQSAIGLLAMSIYLGLGLLALVLVRDVRHHRPDADRVLPGVLSDYESGVRCADDLDWRGRESDPGSAVVDGAGDAAAPGAVHDVADDREGAELYAQRGGQLHSADEHRRR